MKSKFTDIRIRLNLIICLLSAIFLLSCSDYSSRTNDGCNSIYYWRTTFALNDAEKEFLHKHDITKMYVRFFDVSSQYGQHDNEKAAPEATIRFVDSIPSDIKIVPTVYITPGAMEDMQTRENEYADKIVKRINAICRQNRIHFNEIQLDCDWTKSTRIPFFRLCEAVKQHLDSTQCLSSTIRLHQLIQSPPPVDKGVLMVYNTGNLMEMTTDNSIFSYRDIEPYLRDNRLADYQLPLDVAYPTYGWSVVYYPGQEKYYFDRIMRRTDFSSYPQLKKIGNNIYEATSEVDFSNNADYWDKIYENYRVRVERPTAKEILKVKELIDNQLKDKTHNNILYHLDETQFSHYSDNEISKIYTRN
ncbi:MAG: hypothetical protein Q4F07_06915 [Bacteroidales bacterium]|nr:hypothetical protein [Bacteroidales bacterium]